MILVYNIHSKLKKQKQNKPKHKTKQILSFVVAVKLRISVIIKELIYSAQALTEFAQRRPGLSERFPTHGRGGNEMRII